MSERTHDDFEVRCFKDAKRLPRIAGQVLEVCAIEQ